MDPVWIRSDSIEFAPRFGAIANDVPGLVNLQNARGQAKAYQLRQVLRLVEQYTLALENDP
jgi:hypothetical protein